MSINTKGFALLILLIGYLHKNKPLILPKGQGLYLSDELIGQDITLIVIKNHALGAVRAQGDAAADKAVALCREDGLGANDSGAGLSPVVKIAAWRADADRVVVSVKQKIGLHLGHKLRPFAVKLLLNVKRMLLHVRKANVRDDQAVLNARCIVFFVCVGNDGFEILGLLQSEFVEADGVTVFGAGIRFVLAAIHQKSPHAACAEGIVGKSVLDRNVIGHILGVNAARVVVAARKCAGELSARDAGRDLADGVEIAHVTAVVGNVTVEHKKVKRVTEKLSCSHRLGNQIVGIRNMVEVDRALGFDRLEGQRQRALVLACREVGRTVDHFAVADGVFLCLVQYRHRQRHAVHIGARAQNAVAVVIIGVLTHLDPYDHLVRKGHKDLVLVPHRKHRGVGQHVFGERGSCHKVAAFLLFQFVLCYDHYSIPCAKNQPRIGF